MSKNNLPPAQGFGSSSSSGNDPDDDWGRVCMACGLRMSDDMPRGVVVDPDKGLGVQCITCCEADEEAIKFGSPKNPLFGKDW